LRYPVKYTLLFDRISFCVVGAASGKIDSVSFIRNFMHNQASQNVILNEVRNPRGDSNLTPAGR